MGIMESILTAVFCMVVVFVVLACLLVLIKAFSFGLRRFETIGKKTE
jgi:Na+-transporting methylmalonyl-CoA/oxaloacetate decarboxylase gamma subunit